MELFMEYSFWLQRRLSTAADSRPLSFPDKIDPAGITRETANYSVVRPA